jgi:dsRNA-specific ribonuclease
MNNPCNKLITAENVSHILNYYGNIGDNNTPLVPKDLHIYQKSFIHESYHQWVNNYLSTNSSEINDTIYLNYISEESNERLEYLGDHVLKFAMGRYLYNRFAEREGFMTKLKIKLEKSSMLHKFASTLGFKEFLLLSLQVENQTILSQDRGRCNPKYFEDSFEAFIGAIVEDQGEYGCIYAERFITNIIENTIDFSELILVNENFKDSIQRYYQFLRWNTPTYSTLCENGPIYRKIFTRITIIKQEQFNELDFNIQRNIDEFNQKLINYYKTYDQASFEKIYNIYTKEKKYILAIGYGKKVVNAEQECAKNALIMLNLSLNY